MIENILCVLLTIVTTTYSANNIANQNNEEYCDFSSKKAVISERYLSDLDENKYKLYELENGYAIYLVDGEEETFLEGSYEVNSPFFGYEDKETYYLGPGKYFIQENNELSNILEEPIESFNKRRENTIKTYGAVHEDWGSSSEEDDELKYYTLVDNYKYFQSLDIYPTNYLGTCGFVALCILLGYYDTFYNDNFIDNSKTHDARTYKSGLSTSDGEIPISVEENVPLLETVTLPYKMNYVRSGEYPFSEWTSYPGTTQALHDYIFDNYKSYSKIGKSIFGGYPVLPKHFNNMLTSYIEGECKQLQDNIYTEYGNSIGITSSKTKIQAEIDKGIPCAAILYSYTIDDEKSGVNPHTALAYGYEYDKDYYAVNMGLDKYLGKTTILTSSSIFGYCFLEYSGQHVHSQNATFKHAFSYGVCGCGHISTSVDDQLVQIYNKGEL